MSDYRILCVHGIGHAEAVPDWDKPWRDAIEAGLTRYHHQGTLEFERLSYDRLFADAPNNPALYGVALGELAASAAWHAVADPIADLFRPRAFTPRSLDFLDEWHAGMVAQWVVEDDLRRDCRKALLDLVKKFNPNIVCAHSLGTLLAYDTFTFDGVGKAAIKGRTFITFGSQIANTFVRAKAWGGRVRMLDQAKFWYHLYNHDDRVFTAEINLPGEARFREILTDSPAGHAATATPDGSPGYLDHPQTGALVWQALSQEPVARLMARGFAITRHAVTPPPHRALIVGIDDYPDPENRLEGCVNDTFLISALLQENGFDPEHIRVLLNRRATRDSVLERLHWLLDDAGDGAERVLFYSGHGVQIPAYGAKEEVDHLNEGLVCWDFDWDKNNALTDDTFRDLYSQLPYDAHFLAIFDCCYSGGLTRAGSNRMRGLALPDDLRHRLLRWDIPSQSWKPRELPPIIPNFTGPAAVPFTGLSGATQRLGRAVPLRTLPKGEYDATRALRGHKGPYLPVIMEASREDQPSYETRHGTTANGAFTYALDRNLRALRHRGRSQPTFNALIKAVAADLKSQGYVQQPQIVGPQEVLNKPIPGPVPAPSRPTPRRS